MSDLYAYRVHGKTGWLLATFSLRSEFNYHVCEKFFVHK